MVMFFVRALIFLGSAAIGLVVASLMLPGFHLDWRSPLGFILAIVVFAVLQSVLTPWMSSVAQRNAPVLVGGIGIVSSFAALVVVALIPGVGLSIGEPLWTWLAAPVIVWIVTALATVLLPMLFVKKEIEEHRADKR
ncbi:MAG: hypothetical protein QM611_02710 [Microbacterium sp.]|uniref:hypothetical protein n=1 Tax=Microbacterium sp. TaxID=51671 RepID=UPI0039E26A8A